MSQPKLSTVVSGSCALLLTASLIALAPACVGMHQGGMDALNANGEKPIV